MIGGAQEVDSAQAPGWAPVYFERAEVPGQSYFRCPTYAATISTSQCASMWRIARATSGDRNMRCRGCSVGAAHAGEVHEEVSALYGTPICPRCRRTGLRLIQGQVCVSCYNRQREFLIGRNAKGARPVKIKALPPRSIAYADGDGVKVHRRQRALDLTEAMLALLRTIPAQVQFGFRSGVRGA